MAVSTWQVVEVIGGKPIDMEDCATLADANRERDAYQRLFPKSKYIIRMNPKLSKNQEVWNVYSAGDTDQKKPLIGVNVNSEDALAFSAAFEQMGIATHPKRVPSK
jgi:hypothetical protein